MLVYCLYKDGKVISMKKINYFVGKSLFLASLLVASSNVYASGSLAIDSYDPNYDTSELLLPDNFYHDKEYEMWLKNNKGNTKNNTTSYENKMSTKSVDVGDKPAVVCRSHSCTRLNDRITETFLFNSLVSMFYNSQKTKVSICEADPNTRACLYNGIRFGAEIGGTPVVMQISTFTLSDVQVGRKLRNLGFAMSYDVYANGLKSNCNTAKNTIEIRNTSTILITGDSFLCQLTSDIPSQIFNMYNIDYVDLDYDLLGGYFSFGMSGSSKGQKTGYMVMKFDDIVRARSTDTCISCQADSQTMGNQRIAPGQYEVEAISKEEIEKRLQRGRVDEVEKTYFKKAVDQN